MAWPQRLWAFSVVFAAGCSSRSDAETLPLPTTQSEAAEVPVQWVGFYEAAWEREVFLPCGVDEEWWSWSTVRIIRNDPRGWGRAFVVIEGRVSARGRFGHLGRFPRQIVITRALEIRPAEEGVCPTTI